MEIITGYVGKKHVTSEQERDVNQGIVGPGSYVLKTGMQMEAEVSSNNEIKIRDGVLMHQGCAASIKKNTYDSLTIINGSQGMKRIDLIVARYEKNRDDETERLGLKVIQGTPAESNPAVPEYTEGSIQAGDYIADMPMYQVIINGLNITEVKRLFEVEPDIDTLKKELAELNGNSFIRTEVISVTVNVPAAKTAGVFSTPIPPDGFELVATIPTNASGSSCTWATCKAQSDGTVYVAMRNWTTSAANIHPEYTAVYLKK